MPAPAVVLYFFNDLFLRYIVFFLISVKSTMLRDNSLFTMLAFLSYDVTNREGAHEPISVG